MSHVIELVAPASWQDLESKVARILAECGYEVETQKNVKLARGEVTIDVWAHEHTSPPNDIAVECKHWNTAATKNVMHGFRTVVGDSGANLGLIVASAGFQGGAVQAASYSNVRLCSWTEFQEAFVERWHRHYMAPALSREASALVEYTEPINSRVARAAAALDDVRRVAFEELRFAHVDLALGSIPLYIDVPGLTDRPAIPALPLRDSITEAMTKAFPDDVLDAAALRPLLDALISAYREGVAQFDDIFGGRA